jgi:hypothetical protein
MKTVFLLAIVAGFGGTLAGAHFLPWVTHTRLPSHTSVVANGGRAEQFLIRLPVDRIAATDGQAGGLRSAGVQGVMALPAQFVSEPLLVEHFKVRDVAGTVIGVAARHWGSTDAGPTTTWSILIPGRGALLLSAPGEVRGAVDRALQSAGHSAGSEWNGELAVTLTPTSEVGSVAAGSGEFDGFGGSYTETWALTGVGDSGELRGTIALDTITKRHSL